MRDRSQGAAKGGCGAEAWSRRDLRAVHCHVVAVEGLTEQPVRRDWVGAVRIEGSHSERHARHLRKARAPQRLRPP